MKKHSWKQDKLVDDKYFTCSKCGLKRVMVLGMNGAFWRWRYYRSGKGFFSFALRAGPCTRRP